MILPSHYLLKIALVLLKYHIAKIFMLMIQKTINLHGGGLVDEFDDL